MLSRAKLLKTGRQRSLSCQTLDPVHSRGQSERNAYQNLLALHATHQVLDGLFNLLQVFMIALPLLLFDLCFVWLVFWWLPRSSSWRHCVVKSKCYGELRIFFSVEIRSSGTGTSPCIER